MRNNRAQKLKKKYSGRSLISLGAAALLVWSGYELSIRAEDTAAWIDGLRYLSRARQQSVWDNLALMMGSPAMRALAYKLLFLSGCVLLALICLIVRNRPKASVPLLLFTLLAGYGGWSLGLYPGQWSNALQWLKLAPLLLILAGCLVNLFQAVYRGRKRRSAPR
ncbi:MAG: hypothetical protein IJ240_10820 [Clostridia bacterium]|nr:hypothetical protein [Clostridia bacterium]